MLEKRETKVDFDKLEEAVRPWEAGTKKRFYVKGLVDGYAVNANPFVSEKKDRGRYEVELENGFLYLEKSYNNLDGIINDVLAALSAVDAIESKEEEKEQKPVAAHDQDGKKIRLTKRQQGLLNELLQFFQHTASGESVDCKTEISGADARSLRCILRKQNSRNDLYEVQYRGLSMNITYGALEQKYSDRRLKSENEQPVVEITGRLEATA